MLHVVNVVTVVSLLPVVTVVTVISLHPVVTVVTLVSFASCNELLLWLVCFL